MVMLWLRKVELESGVAGMGVGWRDELAFLRGPGTWNIASSWGGEDKMYRTVACVPKLLAIMSIVYLTYLSIYLPTCLLWMIVLPG